MDDFVPSGNLFSAPVLVTGVAGFIGYHVAVCLLRSGVSVVGIDNVNDYYDVSLKQGRLANLSKYANFSFHLCDLADGAAVSAAFAAAEARGVIHLAAQAGVRYSLENPMAYIRSNITGFVTILEECRRRKIDHLVYASSSSVYGMNVRMPFSESQNVDHPVSLYAATKKSNELLAHSYSKMYGLPMTGLRFFTVYGSWGRPDMAYFKFAEAIMKDKPIVLYNDGDMLRDFTYIDDVVAAILKSFAHIAQPNPEWLNGDPDPASSLAPHRVYNIGNNKPEQLLDMVTLLEEYLGKKAMKQYAPMQVGDVHRTFADIGRLNEATGFKPVTPLKEGLKHFTKWFKSYRN